MTYSWNFQVMLLINNMFRQLMHRFTFYRLELSGYVIN